MDVFDHSRFDDDFCIFIHEIVAEKDRNDGHERFFKNAGINFAVKFLTGREQCGIISLQHKIP